MKILEILVTIPNKLYIFTEKDKEGKILFFEKAYDRRYQLCKEKYGEGFAFVKCTKLLIWRQLIHLAGSLFFIVLALLLNNLYNRFDVIILGGLVAFISFQETYLHPKIYNQKFLKGLIDWLVWVLPVIIYFLIKIIY